MFLYRNLQKSWLAVPMHTIQSDPWKLGTHLGTLSEQREAICQRAGLQDGKIANRGERMDGVEVAFMHQGLLY